MDQTSPIIVFDSGFGGISVLKKLVDAMPNENYLYLGDSANAPYGPRSTENVRELTVAAIRSLLPRAPKAVVIACNTATAASLESVQALCAGIPVIGIRPAVKQAEAAGCRCILSLATAGTLASASYARQLSELSPETEVISIPAPGIVQYVEGGRRETARMIAYLRDLFRPAADRPVDAVVLGCTHFPFAKEEVHAALERDVPFFDASTDVAAATRRALEAAQTRETSGKSGSITFTNSLATEEALAISWSLFGSPC